MILCCCSVTKLCLTAASLTAALQASLSFTISWIVKFISIELEMLSNHLILFCPLLLLSSQSFPESRSFLVSGLFTSGGQKSGGSASATVSEYSGLIFFRIDWFDLLAVQGTIRDLLQHNLKVLVLWPSAFMVQLSHACMTTGKTIALTIYGPLSAK